MAAWIRRIVSGQKKRFQNEGFDLDLAYISPRIIAMGLPAEGKDVLYRNPLPEIARFLQTYHNGHSKVYNLCSEYQYDAQKLSVPLQHYPLDDHQTPALLVVQQFCADAADWLAQHPHNVVVVHCKAGKGRTGLMICCLLMYLHKSGSSLANLPAGSGLDCSEGLRDLSTCSVTAAGAAADPSAAQALGRRSMDLSSSSHRLGLGRSSSAALSTTGTQPRTTGSGGILRTASLPDGDSRMNGWHPWQYVEPVQLQQMSRPVQDVLALYAERRTHDGNGVTIASQRRYVGYFWHVLCNSPQPGGLLPQPKALQLRQLVISGLPPGTADGCSVVVEARPSGSNAASATHVWLSPSRRGSIGAIPGLQLCMAPCAAPPQVQDDQCSVTTSTAGDSLTIQLPAASLGLSLLSMGPATASSSAQQAAPQVNNYVQPAAAAAVRLRGQPQSPFAVAAVAAGDEIFPAAGCSSGSNIAQQRLQADSCGISEAGDSSGCCVVEGDVRISVNKGGNKLFFTWFNTAFLPAQGSITFNRDQLDKVAKNIPRNLKLSIQYVDMQPHAGPEPDAEAPETQQQHGYECSGLECPGAIAELGRIEGCKDSEPAALSLPSRPSSSSRLNTAVSDDTVQLGTSVSAPASPQASRTSKAGSWLQFPALSSLGSLPAPLQWPGGDSSSRDLACQGSASAEVALSGFSSAPAAGGRQRAARRERRGRSRASVRAGRQPHDDTTGTHFWDWSWEGLIEGRDSSGGGTYGAAADPAGTGSLGDASYQMHQSGPNAAAAGAALRHVVTHGLQPLKQDSKMSHTATAGIELHAFTRSVSEVAVAPTAAASTALQVPPFPPSPPCCVGSVAEDDDDGGDVFVSDIYRPSDCWDPLLQAVPPSAVPGVLLSSHDPLQGLLEAWHFSLDTQEPRQRRQRHSCSNTSSSRTGSPLLDGKLTKRHSCPSAPATPGRCSASSVSRPWVAGGRASAAAQSNLSNVTDERFCNNLRPALRRTASDAVLPGTNMRVDIAAAQSQETLAAVDAVVAPVTPPPALPVHLTRMTAAPDASAPTAASAAPATCLECLFDMHTGPCPLSQNAAEVDLSAKFEAAVKIAATAVAAATQPQTHRRGGEAIIEGEAADLVSGARAMQRSASTPDSRTAAAASAAASCTVKLTAFPADAGDGLAAALDTSSSCAGPPAVATVSRGQWIIAPKTPRHESSTAGSTAGIGQSISRRSMDLFGRHAGTAASTASNDCSGSRTQGQVLRRSTTGDLSARSASSVGDDQMQGLLPSDELSSSVAETKTVAAVVHQWQQLERAWQRNWL